MIFTQTLSAKDTIKQVQLPTTFSNDLAYLTGVFAGDGCLTHRPHKYEYCLNCGGNPEDEKEYYTHVIAPTFERVFGFIPNMKLMGSTYGFTVYSRVIVLFLHEVCELPIGKKYDTLHIPNWIKHNSEYSKAFLSGVFDTDGNITFKGKYKNPSIQLASKSSNFIKEISLELTKRKFTTYVSLDKKQTDTRLKKGFSIISRLEIQGKTNFRKWEEKITFRSPKHNKKIINYIKNSGGRI